MSNKEAIDQVLAQINEQFEGKVGTDTLMIKDQREWTEAQIAEYSEGLRAMGLRVEVQPDPLGAGCTILITGASLLIDLLGKDLEGLPYIKVQRIGANGWGQA